MDLIEKIELAAEKDLLLPEATEHLKYWARPDFLPEWVAASIEELVAKEAWDELNQRFDQALAFGTGGMRGRTIGRVVSSVEAGDLEFQNGIPLRAAVGTHVLNDFNLVRAVIGLFRYVFRHLETQARPGVPRLVIAHDVRHFSRHFCELAASTWHQLGGHALIFQGPRSTPQLSFSVRHCHAHCGVVITASHNPAHDNGFKVYFEDGAQVVDPHAAAIVEEVNRVGLEETTAFLEIELAGVGVLGDRNDQAYQQLLEEIVLDPEILRAQSVRVVFTPVHGTGSVATVPVLETLGVEVIQVPEQMAPDGRFPTVASPNPENFGTLEKAIARADETGADLVIATDPDADRMGVAARDRDGEMNLLSGNQVGALLAEYRIATLKEAGMLPEAGTRKAALIQTFVTSPLLEAIANGHGLKTLRTLTGFKWIGRKLADYEAKMKHALFEAEGLAVDYDACDVWTRAELLMDYATFFVFGGEESCGYLATDRVRDKDANAASVLLCELAAFLKSQGRTFFDELDLLYLRHGYHHEQNIGIEYEGASGRQKIARILDSYREHPPTALDGLAVQQVTDFGKEERTDADGQKISPQDFYFFELENGCSFAVRGSGTESKIKCYGFRSCPVVEPEQLPEVKRASAEMMQRLLSAVEADARQRAED